VDHALRRARVAERLEGWGCGGLVVTRLPNVRYLTGFTGSNGQLLLATGGSVLFTDGRYEEQSRREAPDLDRRICPDGFEPPLAEVCAERGIERLAFEGEGITFDGYTRMASGVRAELVSVRGAVEGERLVKDGEELGRLRAAQAATDAAFAHVLGRLREGVTERETALELEIAMRRNGGDGVAFASIVAFGEQAAEPHHEPTDRALRRGDVVKLDFGAVVDGYHTDMTRTVAFGEPPEELRAIHELVARAQAAGVGAVRAGATCGEVDAAARSVIEEAGHAGRFPHGLGHGVGLEIHEAPRLRRGDERVLPAGAVVTIEPGVYVPGLGGVRIEDVVLVRETGGEVLPTSTKELVVL
jgi:Xaa-Pro dipeptidase